MGLADLLPVLVCVGAPFFPVFIFIVVKTQLQKRVKSWQDAANHLGFKFTYFIASARSFRMNGLVDQVPVQIKVIVQGSGKHQSQYTVAIADLPSDLPTGLLVGKESFFSGIGSALGFGDIEIGIPQIDDVLNILGEDEAQVREYLSTPSVQKTLVDLVNFGNGSGLRLSDVYLKKQGVVSDTATLIRMARKAARLSTELCVSNKQTEPVSSVAGPDQAESVDPGLEEVHHQEYTLDTESDQYTLDAESDQYTLDSESEQYVMSTEPEQQESTGALGDRTIENPASGSDWKSVSALLADRNTRRSERRKIAKGLEGDVITMSLLIKRTTSDLDTVDPQTGERGALVYGTENGVDIELRVAPKDVGLVAGLKSGDSIEGTGVIVTWDQFYGRMKVDFQP